jgi:hypothetical protein
MNRWLVLGIAAGAMGVGIVGGVSAIQRGTRGEARASTAPLHSVPDENGSEGRVVGGHDKSAESEAAELRAAVGSLRAEVLQLRNELRQSQAPALSQDAVSDAGPRARDPAALAEQQREWNAHMADVEAAFQSEPRDAKWAASTSTRLRDVMTPDPALRSGARAVDCRSQSCRVEIADDGSGVLQKALPTFLQQAADVLPTMQAERGTDGEGHATMILYLTRPETGAR